MAPALLPTIWFRNTWTWGRTGEGYGAKPVIVRAGDGVQCQHETLGKHIGWMHHAPVDWIFTENETDFGGWRVGPMPPG